MAGSDDSGHARRLVVVVGHVADADRYRDGDRLCVLRDAADAGALLDAELPRLGTGWRVLAVGTGPDVRAVRAAALARGALAEEVSVRVLDDGAQVRVHCGVCHHGAQARAGDVLECPGCGTALVVTDHESRVHGAVLGAPGVR
ncbi:MAG TPA: dimethylamine monooxygenase subunit DmmA family protein [Actinomycetospora sp.]|jgi:ribosomal protein S27AE|uniref:dimethylamine monooxygenase subunit DmmA family protein n=1 Tax=Actinomycetospora sp. TaxID=1872135 RepID=UPI002F4165AF